MALRIVVMLTLAAFSFSFPAVAQDSNGSASNSSVDSGNGNAPDLINEKFDGLTFAAGPTSDGDFGAALNGDKRFIWGPFDPTASQDTSDGIKLPLFPFVDLSTDSSWNSKFNSLNQASGDLQLGIDGGLFHGAWDYSRAAPVGGPEPSCSTAGSYMTCSNPAPVGPQRIAAYGFYGDLKYRYGTFEQSSTTSNVSQLLGGGGAYFVWQKGMDQSWIAIWPRVSFTYYAPISTSASVPSADLPAGVKANYLQVQFKSGIFLGTSGMWGSDPNNHPFTLTATYAGSEPTQGSDRTWENLWKVQLSTSLLDNVTKQSTVRPAVTFQSGKNGGLQYNRQVLLGIVADLL